MRPKYVIIEEVINKETTKKLSVLKFFKLGENAGMIKICEKRIFIKTKDDYSKEVIGVLRLYNCISKNQYDMIRYNLINQFHECMLIDYKHVLELEYGHGFECRIYLSNRCIGGVSYEQTNETDYISII